MRRQDPYSLWFIYIYVISQKSFYVAGGGVDGLVVGDGTLNKILPEFYSMVLLHCRKTVRCSSSVG